jgi:hypothetical protein
MNLTLQAISNHLNKHNIHHTITDQDPTDPTYTYIETNHTEIWHTPNNTILIINFNNTILINQQIHLADPELLPKLLKVLQDKQ